MTPTTSSSRSRPPGPPRRRLHTLRLLADDPLTFYERLHRDYGDIVFYEVPTGKNCVVFSADLIKEVLEEKLSVLPPAHPVCSFDVIEAPIVATSQGEDHRRLTELVTSSLAPDRMRGYADALAESIDHHLKRLRPGDRANLRDDFEHLAWDATLSVLFGSAEFPTPEVGRPFLKMIKLKFLVASLPGGRLLLRLPLPFLLRARRATKKLDALTYRAIRRAGDPRHPGLDLVSHLVRAPEQGLVEWTFKNEREVRDMAYSLLFMAYEPVTIVLSFGSWFLARNPEVRERLEQEADEVLGTRPMRGSAFPKLRYAQAVCSELLRIQPPAYTLVPRRAREDTVLGGYSIPKGTVVEIGASVLHTRADYWGDRAGEFQPDRWLTEGTTGTSGCPRDAFLPFSRGPRVCPGSHFATVLMVLALAGLSRRFRVQPRLKQMPKRNSTGMAFFNGPVPGTVQRRNRAPARRTQ